MFIKLSFKQVLRSQNKYDLVIDRIFMVYPSCENEQQAWEHLHFLAFLAPSAISSAAETLVFPSLASCFA